MHEHKPPKLLHWLNNGLFGISHWRFCSLCLQVSKVQFMSWTCRQVLATYTHVQVTSQMDRHFLFLQWRHCRQWGRRWSHRRTSREGKTSRKEPLRLIATLCRCRNYNHRDSNNSNRTNNSNRINSPPRRHLTSKIPFDALRKCLSSTLESSECGTLHGTGTTIQNWSTTSEHFESQIVLTP